MLEHSDDLLNFKLLPYEVVVPLLNSPILSGRSPTYYSHLYIFNIKITPIYHVIFSFIASLQHQLTSALNRQCIIGPVQHPNALMHYCINALLLM